MCIYHKMSQQNIREYNYRKWFLRPVGQNLDLNIASDEKDYNEEVVFSSNLIAQNDGNRLPIYFDLNNSGSSQLFLLNYGVYNSGNTLVSLNYYNPNDENLDMFTASTLCDIGLTAIDNGLVDRMSGETISFTMGLLDDVDKFNRYDFDRRFKMFQVTGYTEPPNKRFSGNTDRTVYEIVSKTNSQIGTYNQLYGGFYQGFFKLFGYDYKTFPNRTNKGWSVEMLLKPRLSDEFGPTSGETTLNLVYPENKNTFFYFGTRGENKFYHHASGSPASDSGYTRVTQSLEGILKTCACGNTGVTNSRCIEVYNPIEYGVEHNIDCNCYCSNNTVINADKDPLYDSMSNAFSVKLNGDPSNPGICVKVLKFTGDCVVTGTTPTTGITYQTGYTVTEYCSESGIFDYCASENPEYLNEEHWFLVDVVWERNTWFDTCDLYYKGGLGLITDFKYVDSLSNNTVNLIEPPVTHTGSPKPDQVEIVNLNERWLIEKSDRLGSLKIYVNSKLFYVINGFEEIIPRGLNAEKEKQLGVPFNISWGGGTQGLRESLTFEQKPACDISFGVDIGLDLLAIISPGSVNIEYILTTSYVISEEITVNFTHILGTTTGNNISITNSITIPPNEARGSTSIILLDDFNTLNGESSFTNVSTTPAFISNNIEFTFESEFIYPTPTATVTPSPTLTPSFTSTPTITPTQTVTPTNPCVEYLTDELGNFILTESGDYIISERNPCITPTPTPTPTNPCVQYLTDELGNFILTEEGDFIISEINTCVSPTPTQTPTSTNTPTPTFTQTPTPTCIPFINTIIISNGSYVATNGTYTRNNPLSVFTQLSGTGVIFFGGDAWYVNSGPAGNVAWNTSQLGTGTWSPLPPGNSSGIIAEYYYYNCVTPTTTPTVTQTPTNTPTPSITSSQTPTPTETSTPTPTPSITPTISITPSITPTTTITPTPSFTPNCVRQIVVPTLWNGATSINSNVLQLTQTSETLQIQVNDVITDNIGATSFVGIVSSDETYTYVFTGPGGGLAFDCDFPLTFSGAC